MTLAIDIGNSRVKAGLYQAGKIAAYYAMDTAEMISPGTWVQLVNKLLEEKGAKAGEIDLCGYSSVVPERSTLLEKWAGERFAGTAIMKIGAENYPYRIDYVDPETLGSDRLAGAMAGFEKFGGPLIVVDFGTAVTFNFIDADGAFLGGAIAPGAKLMASLLAKGTAQLPEIDIEFKEDILGRTTEDSIRIGATYGLVELIDGLISRYRYRTGAHLKAIGTGGGGKEFVRQSRRLKGYYPYLTLDGVALIAQAMAAKS